MTNKKDLFRRMAKNKWAYIFILPLMIGAIGFCYYPAISGIVTSLFRWDGTGAREFGADSEQYWTIFGAISVAGGLTEAGICCIISNCKGNGFTVGGRASRGKGFGDFLSAGFLRRHADGKTA